MSCLKKFSLWLFTGLVICIIGISDVFGLETKTIYSNQTLDNSNKFNYGFVNEGGVDSITIGNVGSRISGKTKYLNFYLSQNVALNYTYTIRINFLADDLQPYFSLNHVKEISVCNSSSCSNSSIVSIKKQNNNGFSTWVELTFNPTQVGNVIGVTLGDNRGSFITGETFFGISSVQIESKNVNQDVIDKATNNTNNIINNNNSNTESIINSNKETQEIIKEQFNTCRDSVNLFSGFIKGIKLDSNNGSISSSSTTATSEFISVDFDKNPNYYLSGLTAQLRSFVAAYDKDKNFLARTSANPISYLSLTTSSFNISSEIDIAYIRVTIYESSNLSGTINDIDNLHTQLVIGSTYLPYEPYGEQICVNKLDEQVKTSKSILGKIGDILSYINPFSENFFAYKLVELIINGLKSLFIPDNFDFLYNFKDTMSEKLGFIASIPLQLIDFIIDLKDYAFSTPTSLTFPTISIFGFSFWNEMTIDITEGLSWVSAIKYVTDIICVILCVNTLRKFYNSFFGGGEN